MSGAVRGVSAGSVEGGYTHYSLSSPFPQGGSSAENVGLARSRGARRGPVRGKEEREDGGGRGAGIGLEQRGGGGPGVPRDRPGDRVGPDRRPRGGSAGPRRLVRGGRLRRRVEDGQRRHHLAADLRRRGVVLDRLRDDRPEQSEHRLGRHRREQQPAQRGLRRRRLQVDRRRQVAGRTWASTESEHIGRIVVDPRDSNVVYVAAQGPLWSAGGDRGLYKTTDGGETWKNDPRDQRAHRRQRSVDRSAQSRRPLRVVLSAPAPHLDADQRRSRVGDLQVDRRRRDLDQADERPADRGHGHASGWPSRRSTRTWSTPSSSRSTTRAASSARPTAAPAGRRRSDYVSGSPQYYNEIVPDPHDVDRVYSLDTWMHVTDDGGASFQPVPETSKHVDNHALWIDPEDADHLVAGCDGGVYESFDRGANWEFKANLPITQFYKIAVDDDLPFYNVYGGTQDNSTLGGPCRTTSTHGITNRDWFVIVGGDGFEPRSRAGQPDIVYSRVAERRSRALRPQEPRDASTSSPSPRSGEAPSRWNWDSPLLISPHSPDAPVLRLAAPLPQRRPRRHLDAGERRSHPPARSQHARGDGQGLERRHGGQESLDVVSSATSSRSPSRPIVEGLLYVGTDDGLIQVSEDGGARPGDERQTLPGVPDMSLRVRPGGLESRRGHRVTRPSMPTRTATSSPTCSKSSDRGRTWQSIAGDLPERGIGLHVRPGPRACRAALCRHRVRRLLHRRRRRALGPAQGRPADHRGARPRDPAARERSRARHLRPRLLSSSTTTRRCAAWTKRRSRPRPFSSSPVTA